MVTENKNTILVIDDDPGVRISMKDLLENEGYKVQLAGNGQIGLDVLRTSKGVGLVLLDLSMPVMNGQQFLSEIENDSSLAFTRVVVVSSEASVETSRGAMGFIKKPVNVATLLTMVRKFCNQKTVLYIDDDRDLCTLYCSLMQSDGYHIRTASSGETALLSIESYGVPDLIFLDFNMPCMNGDEFVHAAKIRFPQFTNTKIIGFTGYPVDSPYIQDFKMVVNEVLQKPNGLEDFRELVKRLLP